MRIVFFGSSEFSVPSLIQNSEYVAAVVTRKARPRGRGYRLDDNEVKRAAQSLAVPLIELDSFKDDMARSIADYKPDLFVVVSFGLILPRWSLQIPSLGPVNIHPSLLPRYRGPSPIQWALVNGDAVTGITYIKMNEKMDEGDIISQVEVPVEARDNYITLSRRLSEDAARHLADLIAEIERKKSVAGTPQDHASATYAPMITKEMGKIDWNQTAHQIACRVRAFVTWPAAFTVLDGKSLKIFDASAEEETAVTEPPGTVVRITKTGIEVATGKGVLAVGEVQLENKKRMAAYDFARGYRDLQGKLLN